MSVPMLTDAEIAETFKQATVLGWPCLEPNPAGNSVR